MSFPTATSAFGLVIRCHSSPYAFSALTLLVGSQEEHPARKN